MADRLTFPEGKRFAFTVFDDTDKATVENVRPVYDLLADLGLRTTKSVWPLAPTRPSPLGGATLADPAYLEFVLALRDRGFEIASHGATNHSSTREETARGLERFRELLGCDPKVHCNHAWNEENIYWGAARLSGRLWRAIYRLATVGKPRRFYGHDPESPYFWGDLCRKHVQYVRNFTFRETNVLKVNPTLPYHDPARPYVNYWFSSTEGADVRAFCRAVSPAAQDRLEAEGGVCIMYAHFAKGFVTGRALDGEFQRLMEMLAARSGWFVPVGELLDYLRLQGTVGDIPRRELAQIERRWIREKVRHRAR